MNIHINGQRYALSNSQTVSLTEALTWHFSQQPQSSFAVALNGDFISKTDYPYTQLQSGDSVDILQPIQGG